MAWDDSEASTVPAHPVIVLNLEGPLTLGEAADSLRKKVDLHLERGRRRVIVDLTQVPYMDTAGIGELVRCVKRIAEAQGRMVVVPGEANHAFLGRFRLDAVFDLQPGLAEAYARLEEHDDPSEAETLC